MKSFVNLLVIAAFAVATCAAVRAESPTGMTESEPVQTAAVSPSATVPDDAPVVFKEVSGFWISTTTGNLSNFSLKDVRVSGQSFTAKFSIGSAVLVSCSLTQDVKGTYINNIFEFEMPEPGTCWHSYFKGTINMTDRQKGFYASGRQKAVHGWLIVRIVDKV